MTAHKPIVRGDSRRDETWTNSASASKLRRSTSCSKRCSRLSSNERDLAPRTLVKSRIIRCAMLPAPPRQLTDQNRRQKKQRKRLNCSPTNSTSFGREFVLEFEELDRGCHEGGEEVFAIVPSSAITHDLSEGFFGEGFAIGHAASRSASCSVSQAITLPAAIAASCR